MADGVKVVSPERAAELDRALDLKMISIRLPASLIEDYQLVGKLKGSLYQPLMRMALVEWIEREKSNLLKGVEFDQRERRREPPPARSGE